jgi:hypothetical protein
MDDVRPPPKLPAALDAHRLAFEEFFAANYGNLLGQALAVRRTHPEPM